MKLWLDDIRPAPEGWVWVKDYHDCIKTLMAVMLTRALTPTLHPGAEMVGEFTHMSFDHDLADVHYAALRGSDDEDLARQMLEAAAKEKTGYDVALWMAEHDVWPTEEVRVHSFNPVGAKRICGVVDRYGPYETRTIWVPLMLDGKTVDTQMVESMKRWAKLQGE